MAAALCSLGQREEEIRRFILARVTPSGKIIRVVFALMLAYGAYELYGALKKPAPAPGKAPAEPPAQVSAQTAPVSRPARSETQHAPEDWGRDPFVSAHGDFAPQRSALGDASAQPGLPPLQLRAVSRLGQEASALIGRHVCRVGDVVQGHRVVSIEDDQVVLAQGKRRIVLTLPGR